MSDYAIIKRDKYVGYKPVLAQVRDSWAITKKEIPGATYYYIFKTSSLKPGLKCNVLLQDESEYQDAEILTVDSEKITFFWEGKIIIAFRKGISVLDIPPLEFE